MQGLPPQPATQIQIPPAAATNRPVRLQPTPAPPPAMVPWKKTPPLPAAVKAKALEDALNREMQASGEPQPAAPPPMAAPPAPAPQTAPSTQRWDTQPPPPPPVAPPPQPIVQPPPPPPSPEPPQMAPPQPVAPPPPPVAQPPQPTAPPPPPPPPPAPPQMAPPQPVAPPPPPVAPPPQPAPPPAQTAPPPPQPLPSPEPVKTAPVVSKEAASGPEYQNVVLPEASSPEAIQRAREALYETMPGVAEQYHTSNAVAVPGEAAPPPAKGAGNTRNVEKPKAAKDLSQIPPLQGPPSPLPASKEQRLQDLLQLYRTDRISPEEYHAQRSKILAEP